MIDCMFSTFIFAFFPLQAIFPLFPTTFISSCFRSFPKSITFHLNYSISLFINYLNLQRGTYGSPTVARPLQNILQTVHCTWLHIFHEDGVFRTLLHSYISNIQDQSFHQYKVLN